MIEQRKTVSVVFADLVDSTALAERLDPEVLAGLLRRYFEALRAVVEKHGGTVEKFIGDAVVGVFGVPTIHEDDALRAVRAALEMHAAVAALSADLAIRVGVNTGEVVVTAQNALGHATSMAARLQQNAEAGDVLIGKQTFELVNAAVDAEALESLIVKGSTEPLAAWRVIGTRALIPRGSVAAHGYVGREKELVQIAAAFESAVSLPACVTLTIVAPPGVGKSRLIAEAVARTSGSSRVIGGRCLPYGEAITYAPLVEAVRQLETTDGADALDRALGGQSDAAAVLATLRSTMDGAARGSPDETAWAFRRLFDTLAADRPLVLIVDDIHWADALLLDLIEYVGTFSVGSPMLIICAARPDLFDTRPGWSAPRENASQIRLAPLTAAETEGLLADALGHGLDDEALRRIVETSGGVPLFVEQMAAFGAESGHAAQVPPTIRALLAARIDRLPHIERVVLEHAAIQGATFRRDTLAEVLPDDARSGLGTQLIALIRRELIRVEPGGGPDTFGFNHALIRDAVYVAMPRSVRADLHVRYAEALSRRTDTPAELIGYQLEQAYRQRVVLGETGPDVVDLARRAGLVLAESGRNASARKESSRAVELLTRASDLLTVDAQARATVLPDFVEALFGAGEVAAGEALHEEAVAVAREAGDVTSELRADMARSMSEPYRDLAGWQERVLAVSARASEHFAKVGDHSALARALLLKGLALGSREQDAAVLVLQQAQVHARQSNDERIQVEVWDELGGVMLFGPTPYDEILEFTRGEVEWAREHGIAFAIADGRLGEAYALAAVAEFDAALEVLHVLIGFFAQLPGRVPQHGECYTLAGRIERDRGDPSAALRYYETAMDLFEASGHRRWWRNAASGAALALLDLNRVDRAQELLTAIAAQDDSTASGRTAVRLEAEARFRARVGDIDAAMDLAREAVAAVADTGAPFYEGRARETLGDLFRVAGDGDSARREYELARSLYERKGYVPGVRRIDSLS